MSTLPPTTDVRCPSATVARVGAFLDTASRFDVDALRRCFTSDAEWWVDTGPDRAVGDRRHVSNSHEVILHGRLPIAAKLERLQVLSTRLTGSYTLSATHVFGDAATAAVAASGVGMTRSGGPYRNNHLFVLDFEGELIAGVHEYCDTLYALKLLVRDERSRHSVAEPPAVPVVEARKASGAILLELVSAMGRGESARLMELCTPSASWWFDGAVDRGGPAAPVHAGASPPPARGRALLSARSAIIAAIPSLMDGDGLALVPQRLLEGDNWACVEVEGIGTTVKGRMYQNRYTWTATLQGGKVAALNEYLDTRHVRDTFAP
jgi:ketosteroid isomerase-like protein